MRESTHHLFLQVEVASTLPSLGRSRRPFRPTAGLPLIVRHLRRMPRRRTELPRDAPEGNG